MQLSTVALLAVALATTGAVASHPHAVDHGQYIQIPAVWQSPLFKSSAGHGGTSSPSNPHHNTTLQENFQIHEPAPILTSSSHSCSIVLVQRSFGNSYGSPSYLSYTPSSFAGTRCAEPSEWTGLTLDVYGETRGRQFDRLGTVWVGNNETGQGVEVMRLDNPEPTRAGVYWEIKKDVGKYFSLFSQDADVVFDLPNIVDSTYTGALNVTLSLTASVNGVVSKRATSRRSSHSSFSAVAQPLKKRAANMVMPLSKRLRTNNSIFLLGGSAGNGTTPVTIPSNTARAIVEIYASGTATEEFWYTGIPDRFYDQIPDAASNGYYGHGTYREIQLYIDGQFAGYVTPYPVIFTGGINPLLWKPSGNYGTYDQPSYNVDITPWLGELTDGKAHEFELAVVSSERDGEINDSSWFVSGNVQVYLDASGKRTTGKVLKVEEGGETVDGYVTGKLDGNPLQNGNLTYKVGLKKPRTFGVAGSIKTGSGIEYVAGWYQTSKYTNTGFVNATAQINDQKSYGFTRSLILNHASLPLGNTSFDTLSTSAVQLDFNYPLYAASYLSGENYDVLVNQQFDRTVRSSPASPSDLTKMVGDETTLIHAKPVAALPHTTLSHRKSKSESILVNGSIANGTGTSWQSFMYRDMAGGTIDRETRTNTTNVLEDRLSGSVAARAQPGQLAV